MSRGAGLGRPARLGSAIAVFAGAGAVGAVADAPTQRAVLAIELGGLLAVALGVRLVRRENATAGVGIGLSGAVLVLASLALAGSWPAQLVEKVELLPGVLGIAIVALGVLPARRQWTRYLLGIGAIAVAASVLTSGLVRDAAKLPLLAGMAMAIVSWDAGEQAVALGEQVGRGTGAVGVQLAHVAGSAAVGAVSVLLAVAVYDLDVSGVPLAGLALLLGAVLALALALYA